MFILQIHSINDLYAFQNDPSISMTNFSSPYRQVKIVGAQREVQLIGDWLTHLIFGSEGTKGRVSSVATVIVVVQTEESGPQATSLISHSWGC